MARGGVLGIAPQPRGQTRRRAAASRLAKSAFPSASAAETTPLSSATKAFVMALENRSFGRQLFYLLLTFVILLTALLVLARYGW